MSGSYILYAVIVDLEFLIVWLASGVNCLSRGLAYSI